MAAAIRINSLTQILGCDGHIALYANTSSLVQDIQFLGFRMWRDGIGNLTAPQLAVFQSIVNAGVPIIGFPFMQTPPTNTVVAAVVSDAKKIFNMGPNALFAVEGPDEPGNNAFEFGGVATTTSWSAVSAFQSAYYAAIKADSQLGTGAANIQVWTPSLVGEELDNAGLQFGCVVPAGGGGSSTSGGTVFADILNCHVYPMFDTSAAQTIDPIAGDAYFHQLGADFVSTYLHGFAGLTLPAAKTLPHAVTEFGYGATGGTVGGTTVDVPTQGKCILNGIMNAWVDGYLALCVNTLYEIGGGFGLFSGPGSPTLAGTYLHNFITPLQDTAIAASSFVTGTLNYTISGLPVTGNSALFQKSNGLYELIIWNNVTNWNFATGVPIVISPTSVTITFTKSQSLINVYDPLTSSSPTSTSNSTSVIVSLKDYPLIVEINPGAPIDILVPTSTGIGAVPIHSPPQSNPAGTSDTVALPFQGVNAGVPAPAIAFSSGSITNPPSSFSRPANTTPYATGNLIANSSATSAIVVPSFPILSSGGGVIIPRLRVITNASSGWNNVQLSINLWSAAPTYFSGDGLAYSVATGAASWLANFSVILTQLVDGAVGSGILTAGNGAAIKLRSGTIFYDIHILNSATPISTQTFSVVPELLN
jgi:hypothetical protein